MIEIARVQFGNDVAILRLEDLPGYDTAMYVIYIHPSGKPERQRDILEDFQDAYDTLTSRALRLYLTGE